MICEDRPGPRPIWRSKEVQPIIFCTANILWMEQNLTYNLQRTSFNIHKISTLITCSNTFVQRTASSRFSTSRSYHFRPFTRSTFTNRTRARQALASLRHCTAFSCRFVTWQSVTVCWALLFVFGANHLAAVHFC